MSVSVTNIFQGGAVISFAPYIAPVAGAEPTGHVFTDAGGTLTPLTIDQKNDYHDFTVEQKLAAGGGQKIGSKMTIKGTLGEATLKNLVLVWDQPAANVTGTEPSGSLVDRPSDPEQFLAIQVVGVSGGPLKTRTHVFWRCLVKECAEIAHAKGEQQKYAFTAEVYEDWGITVAAKATRSKITDS